VVLVHFETAVIHFWLPGGVRRRPQRVTFAGSSGGRDTLLPRRGFCCGRAPPLLRLLLLVVLLYSQFGD